MTASKTDNSAKSGAGKAGAEEVWIWSPLDGVTRNAAGEVIIRFADDAPDFAAQTRRGRLASAAPDLLEALKAMVARYVSLAGSGDCGFWDPETEDEVIAARKAIAEAGSGG
jgi:hypothetical protein